MASAYLHKTSLDVWYLSFSSNPVTASVFDVWRHFGCRFGDDEHPIHEDRDAVLRWAEKRGLTVVPAKRAQARGEE